MNSTMTVAFTPIAGNDRGAEPATGFSRPACPWNGSHCKCNMTDGQRRIETSARTTSHRNPSFDVLKALLILWVVWGHFQSTGVIAPSQSFLERLCWRVKVANMPAFFAISGYFALSTFRSGTWSKILARITMFAWPMASFAVVFTLTDCLLGDAFSRNHGVIQQFLWLFKSKWFLRTLGVLYFLSAAVYRLGKTDRCRWLLFGILWISLLVLPQRARPFLGFADYGQLVQMFPYFVFGLMALRTNEVWRKRPVRVACLLLFFGIILQEDICRWIGLSTWRAAPVSWMSFVLFDSALWHLAARTLLGITGTVSLLGVVEGLVRRFPSLSRLSCFGTTTMGVYIVHEHPLEIATSYGISLPPWTRCLATVLWFLVCHAIVRAILRNNRTRTVFFSDESMLRHWFEKLSFRSVPNATGKQ